MVATDLKLATRGFDGKSLSPNILAGKKDQALLLSHGDVVYVIIDTKNLGTSFMQQTVFGRNNILW